MYGVPRYTWIYLGKARLDKHKTVACSPHAGLRAEVTTGPNALVVLGTAFAAAIAIT